MSARPLVIGVGNRSRRDDGAGPEAVRRLAEAGWRIRVLPGEGTELLEAWRDETAVIVIDAMRGGQPPGTLQRFDAADTALPIQAFPCLSHQFGLAEAVEMGRILGRLPPRLTVWGIEAVETGLGEGLSAPVAAAVERLIAQLTEDIQG